MFNPIISGNIKNAYGQDHAIADNVVQPPSTIGKLIPVCVNIAEMASLSFIPTTNPAMIMVIGTKIAAPNPRIQLITFPKTLI